MGDGCFLGVEEDISTLVDEYKGGTDIQRAKVQVSGVAETENGLRRRGEYLSTQYALIQRVKGDGNCFLRAFAFGLLRYVGSAPEGEQLDQLVSFFRESKDVLLSEGFSEFIEDFWEGKQTNTLLLCLIAGNGPVLMEQLVIARGSGADASSKAAELVNSDESDYVVCYLRLLISGHLKRHSNEFQAFLEAGQSVTEFCLKEVEPMAVESDQIHIIALSQQLAGVLPASVSIEYLDLSDSECTNHFSFPEGLPPFLFLLYRPGHYDILLPK